MKENPCEESSSEGINDSASTHLVAQKPGLTRARTNAFEAVEEYRHHVNNSTQEILQLLNDDSAISQSTLREIFGRVYSAQEEMMTKVSELLRAEETTNEVD